MLSKKAARLVLGVAGYIGSGKSLAGHFFEKHGAKFIEADKVVDDLYRIGQPGYLKIANFFGEEFLRKNREINRKKLAKFVFADVNKLKILNNLIHPLVADAIHKIIDACPLDLIVIEAVYFEEKFLGRFVDKILWIESSRNILLERSLTKPGMTVELFNRILKCQTRPADIDFVIDNNGSVEEFYSKLGQVLHNLGR